MICFSQGVKKYLCMLLVLALVLLTGCNERGEASDNLHFVLAGEGENWEVVQYEVQFSQEAFKAGDGKVIMKNNTEYISDSFQVVIHVVVNGKDRVLHRKSVSGDGVDIAAETIGTLEGNTYLNKDGQPVAKEDITSIYAVIHWWSEAEEKRLEERVNLFSPYS